jgi:hypothetical protein
MSHAARKQVARLLRSYRRMIAQYTRQARERQGWQAEQASALADQYRMVLAGACDMLDTIRSSP